MAQVLGYTTMDSPIGPLLIASTKNGLCFIEFGDGEQALSSLQRWCRKTFMGVPISRDDQGNQSVREQLEEYFAGTRKTFDIPLDMYGTPFQKAVWTELTRIPYGETRSYKEIALSIGAAKAVRAIGGANNRNPIPIVVPCHRVIGSNGALVGYGGGLSIKAHLLALEGAHAASLHPDSPKAVR
ncbi:methylated-DNA--[protein]-cysteine S-methyltransferase [Brevibacillus sedimenti]|uniref:methylated-DNA--[protein]-cysteine S-methyltransferase n=1 Tax=Brevibacillus sedimenti TaxID=2613334 RepID=UPI001E51878A|nr:methylated-DNA--[protein]-cysteine S-methyltransferase [Anoxybacillus sediminis]UFJ62909.1 methylated-DNA--[protein]-cysteine S-methyltransferase [Anoxybacillus sediminis]